MQFNKLHCRCIPNFLQLLLTSWKLVLSGTVTSAGVLTVTAGGPGSTATGQYVSEITVID